MAQQQVAVLLQQAVNGDLEGCLQGLKKLSEGAGPERENQNSFKARVSIELQRVFDEKLEAELSTEELGKFLNIAKSLSDAHVAHEAQTLQIFADLFDARTIEDCKKYWTILEENQQRLVPVEQLRGSLRAELLLLQLSNALLARLSKVIDTNFSGRIQLFLSRLLPLDHKASLNLSGNFNSQNVTAFENSTDDNEVCL